MSFESVWNVLRWVLAALAAGFIGQFGRSLALRIIERRRREAKERADAGSARYELEKERIKAFEKIEKKRAKAQVKLAKKSKEKGDGG